MRTQEEAKGTTDCSRSHRVNCRATHPGVPRLWCRECLLTLIERLNHKQLMAYGQQVFPGVLWL